MHLVPGQCYHIFNRGNNQERIFFSRANQLFLLDKFRRHLLPEMRLLAWCLMPNHFHLIVDVRDESSVARCGAAFRTALSSYTRAIQRQQRRTGSLFQQQTQARNLREGGPDYALMCFCYLHQNPWRAGLVGQPQDWEWSSLRDYLGLRTGTLCDQATARELFDLPASADELLRLVKEKLSGEAADFFY